MMRRSRRRPPGRAIHPIRNVSGPVALVSAIVSIATISPHGAKPRALNPLAAAVNLIIVGRRKKIMANSSRLSWKPVDLPIVEQIRGSTDARELPRADWPSWAHRSTQFTRILAFSVDSSEWQRLDITCSSTAVVAVLLAERRDHKDTPKIHNYNVYLIAETTRGEFFLSPPICPTSPAHHSSSPSTWFDCIGPPL